MAYFVKPEERVVYPGTVVVKPLEEDAGNTDIKLNNTSYLVVPNIVAAQIKPVSINHEPWTSFGTIENRTFIDDFCHDKELTIKAQANTYNGATIKIKQAANIDKGNVKLKDEIKLWFPLFSRMRSALHFKLTNDATRVHYDHGLQNISGHNVNLYGSFGFLRDWSNYNFKLGVALLEKNVTVDTRLKVDNKQAVTLYHRTTGRINEFKFGVIGALDITKRELVKKDLLIGYEKNEIDVSIKAQQPFTNVTKNYQNWREWFETFTLTAIYKRNLKEKYGVEVVANPQNEKVTATGLIEYKHSDRSSTKIKFDNVLNLTLVVKKTITDKLSFSFGTLIPLKRQKEEAQSRNKFGVQLDFNI